MTQRAPVVDDHEFRRMRYSALMQLWVHHNEILFQWPSIIITAALVVISVLISDVSERIRQTRVWQNDIILRLEAGVPLLLTGLAIIIMIYAMGRSRKIVLTLDRELSNIEQLESSGNFNFTQFDQINHPRGFSSPKLLRLYMTIFLAAPLMFLGVSMVIGNFFPWGVATWILLVAAWAILEWQPSAIAARQKLFAICLLVVVLGGGLFFVVSTSRVVESPSSMPSASPFTNASPTAMDSLPASDSDLSITLGELQATASALSTREASVTATVTALSTHWPIDSATVTTDAK